MELYIPKYKYSLQEMISNKKIFSTPHTFWLPNQSSQDVLIYTGFDPEVFGNPFLDLYVSGYNQIL